MSENNGHTVAIPQSSALHSHSRFGTQGNCMACNQPVSAHFGHKGVWVGCPSDHVPVNTPMILMIDRRAPHPMRRATDHMGTSEQAPATTGHVRRAADTPKRGRPRKQGTAPAPMPGVSYVRYSARFPLSHKRVATIEGETDKAIYGLLAKSKRGLSRAELLAAMGATKRTGIVDGAIRRLKLRYKAVISAYEVA